LNRKIKLLWDFRGPDASETAKHHALHLAEFIKKESLVLNITGHTDLTALHAVAYMVVEETNMMQIRDALLPHRGEVYEEKIT
jgi:nucleotide-binding universal stress UspA family protein